MINKYEDLEKQNYKEKYSIRPNNHIREFEGFFNYIMD